MISDVVQYCAFSNNPLLYYNYAAFLHRIDRRAEAAEQMKALFKVYQQTGPQQAQLEDKVRGRSAGERSIFPNTFGETFG